jgi:hypothetical protein
MSATDTKDACVRHAEIHTAEPLIPENAILLSKTEDVKPPAGIYQIPAEDPRR